MVTRSEIKYIQSLGDKKARDQDGVVVAEGDKIVTELLNESPLQIKRIYATQHWISDNGHLIPDACTVAALEEEELQKLSFLVSPPSVIALVLKPNPPSVNTVHGISLLLDQIQDPGNLGTIIRTCDWFDVSQIICSADTADAFNPKVIQSSMGSVFRVPISYTDLNQFIQQHPNVPLYAALLDGQPITNVQCKKPCFLLVGNESRGVSEKLLRTGVQKVTIPRVGKAESLNAAVASAILLSWLSQSAT